MNPSTPINPTQKYNRLAIISLVSGLAAMVFPLISVAFLVTLNGGAGYLQSIFLGISVAILSIITGIVSLASSSTNNQKGAWMGLFGIGFAVLFFIISWVLVMVLIFPYLVSIAR